LFLLVLLHHGCASTVRYADREILWRDPDDSPIPVPAGRELGDSWVRVRAGLFTPIDGVLRLDRRSEAQNVNALDEVPDSSWFEDPRRARTDRGLSFGAVEISAPRADAPELSSAMTIVEGKVTGGSRGFVAVDSRGRRYLLKLDPPGYFGLATSTEVVAARLVAAAGWHVPSISLIELDADQLTLSPDAKIKGADGGKRSMTAADLRRFLEGVPRTVEGRYRFTASAWIEGKILGPYSYVGRRNDDANDRVAHEDRRELRGYRVFSSWINNVDAIETNTLDAYVGAPGRGHLVHYQQDVGGSFGNYAVGPLQSWMGYESYFDGARVLASFLALGAYSRPWARHGIELERQWVVQTWPELGWFEADHFEPRAWAPLWHNPAFERATARDLYWGAKRVLAFGEDELRAAIATGRYRPEAARRLFEVLWRRREKIGRAYLQDVAPFERLHFVHNDLCFDDLVVEHGYDRRPAEYEARGAGQVVSSPSSRRCVALPMRDGYHVVELRVRRAGARRYGPALRVHYVEEGGARRLIGLER